MARGAELLEAWTEPRPVALELLTGRALYERVVRDLLHSAKRSVWIATANLKELRVDAPAGTRARAKGEFVSVLEVFEGLAARGVELRVLHAGLPSGPFARELVARRALLKPGEKSGRAALALRRCPRVHLKCVLVDGTWAYLGSANWTGAGLGARGEKRRNFELGVVTSDCGVLDELQGFYEQLWKGAGCAGCGLREECPEPLDRR